MKTLALPALEKIINACLSSDEEALKKLSSLSHKVIAIKITDWNLQVYIKPTSHGVELLADPQTPDCIVSGNLFSLFKVSQAKGNSIAIIKNAIDISGDNQVGEALQNILSELDIDWEELLSKYVGDVFAHKISLHLHNSKNFTKNTLLNLGNQFKNYMQSESRNLPTSEEVERFIQDVITLQYDVDHIERLLQEYIQIKETSR